MNKFKLNPFDVQFTLKQLSQLKTNKAIGLDQISARLLKDSASVIADSLALLFNRSLDSGNFPSLWTCSEVSALFKSGDRCDPNNYRPMLLLQFRLTRYNTLVLPLLDYWDIVWGDKDNSTLMENLQLLQNKDAKIILNRHPQSSASEALDSLGWKQLHLRRRFHRCTTIFKCFIDFNFNFVRNNTIHNYNTRSRDDFHLPRRLELSKSGYT